MHHKTMMQQGSNKTVQAYMIAGVFQWLAIAFLLIVLQALVGCGRVEVNQISNAESACTVQQNEFGALILCPDGSSALVLHGKDSNCGKCHGIKK